MKKQIFAATAIAASLFAGSASAGIVWTTWQSATTGIKGTTGATTTVTLNQYDAAANSGYALVGVQVKATATGYAAYRVVDDFAAPPSGINFQYSAPIAVTLKGTGALAADTLVTVTPTSNDIARSVAAAGTYTSPGFSPFDTALMLQDTQSNTGSYTGGAFTAAMLTFFSGSGTFALASSATTNPQYNADNDGTFSSVTRYDATYEVRYAYDMPIPAPGALGLMSLGLAGLGVVSRRKKQLAA